MLNWTSWIVRRGALLVMSLLLAGCSSTQAPGPTAGSGADPSGTGTPARGGSLTLAIEQMDPAFDPLGHVSFYGNLVNFQIFDRLLENDFDAKPAPALAESLTPSEGGKVWTIKLRDAKFQDGTPVQAEDVKYSFDWVLDPSHGFIGRGRVTAIDSIDVVDPKTVKFMLKAPTAPFVDSLDLVAIVPKHLMEKDPKDFQLHPVGSGPFKLKEFAQGDRVVLEANPDYFAGRPSVDQVTFRNIPDASTRVAELQSGGVDLALPVLGTQAAQLDGQRGVRIEQANAAVYREIGLNNARPPFDSKQARQAFSYAIDRQAIVNTIWPGFTPAVGPITPNSWAFDSSAQGFTYDPQKAKDLLAQAGYPNGVDVQYLISTREGEDREAALIQQQASAAGFRISISKMEFSALLQKTTLQNDFQAARIGVSQTADPDTLLYLWYQSSNIGNGGLNFGGYRNPDVDKLLDDGRTNIDQSQRTKDYQQAQKILLDDAPAVWMYYEKWIYGVGPKVQDFRPHPSGYFALKTPFGGNVSTTSGK